MKAKIRRRTPAHGENTPHPVRRGGPSSPPRGEGVERTRAVIAQVRLTRRAAWFVAVTMAVGVRLASGASETGGVAEISIVMPDDVVRDALSHSRVLQASKEEVEAADARYAQARAQGLPTLGVELDATHFEGLQDSTLGPGIVIPSFENHYAASATVTQPLYTGGRIRGQKASARSRRRAAALTHQATEADVIFRAATAFWNWSKAFNSVDALKASVAKMEVHTSDMQTQYEAGLVTDNDLLAMEVLLDQTLLRLEEARRRVDLARAGIAFLTGRELPEAAVPAPAPDPGSAEVPTADPLLSEARSNRAERASREMELRAAEALVDASGSGFRPQVFLTARYEQARPNNLFFPPADEWNDDAFAGAVATWSLFDSGLTRAKVREAKARAAQARLQLAEEEERIALEVKEARIDLANALERFRVASRAEQSAQRGLRSATDLWQNGLKPHAEVLDAYAQLVDAQSQVVSARADIAMAREGLRHAVGRPGAADAQGR